MPALITVISGSLFLIVLMLILNRKNREHVLINYGRGYFVRDKRFRLNQDGKLYDIPVTSNATRYSEQVTTNLKHQGHRRRLQTLLDNFMAIENEYTTDKVQPLNNKK